MPRRASDRSPKSSTPPATPGSGTGALRSQAYREIRKRILDGTLAPAAPLSENQLSAELELSRTPVREALARLEREGLIRTVPGRGAFVSELTPHDIREIYEVREQLEGFAARLAAERMSEGEIEALEKILRQTREAMATGAAKSAWEGDIALHRKILEAAQNRRLITILATLDDQMHRIRTMWTRTPTWQEDAMAEHEEIVACIKRRDPAAAEAALRRHLRGSLDHAIRQVMSTY
jgi:DNA-binding GntR family transcriptional regulator